MKKEKSHIKTTEQLAQVIWENWHRRVPWAIDPWEKYRARAGDTFIYAIRDALFGFSDVQNVEIFQANPSVSSVMVKK